MKLKLSLVTAMLAVVLSAAAAVATTPATAAKPVNGYAIPAAGTTTTGLPVVGTFTISKFKLVNGVVTAVGTFAGSVNGGPTVSTAGTVPVTAINGKTLNGSTSTLAAAAASCQILDLTLGPLHLDLLGLVVDLNQVHLQITAQSGPGNLLGNLLCAVAGLLDNTPTGGLSGILQAIVNLLNQILGQL